MVTQVFRATAARYIRSIKLFRKSSTGAAKRLKYGDDLCRKRSGPMTEEFFQRVSYIYKKCKSVERDPPLMLALEWELEDMVWGFIDCAKDTKTNLHTDEKGDECIQNFFWLENNQGETAFHVAIKKGYVDIAIELLKNAPARISLANVAVRKLNTLRPYLKDYPQLDWMFFYLLEYQDIYVETDSQRELKIQNKGVVTENYLDRLSEGLLGWNANNNTVLHLVCKIGNVACVEYILEKYPSQLYCHNSDNETPAYVAAREGHADILHFMIRKLKEKKEIESILTRSMDKNNALHIAIQNHHPEVVFLLIQNIPQLANRMNEYGISPLYLAAERGYSGIVELMLQKCKDIAIEGPKGKTALHAAAISDSTECISCLLDKYTHLLNVKDKLGWTPLLYAVYHNNLSATRMLLEKDDYIGYHELILEDGTHTSAIHIAASHGHYKTMEILMEICPGCTEFIDNEGRNILHIAVINKKYEALKFMFQDETLTNLINQKDKNGNTPIHLLAASDFEKTEMLIDSRVDINVINNKNLTPLDMISSNDQRDKWIKAIHDKPSASLSSNIHKSGQTEIEGEKTNTKLNIVDNVVVVVTLIATASFAAAFTVPGGFDSNDGSTQGTPFLLGKPAFQAFIVANTIAFSSSCWALFRYLEVVLYRYGYDETAKKEYVDGKVGLFIGLQKWPCLQ